MKTVMIGCALLLAACTTTSDIVPAGNGAYMVSVDSGIKSQGQARIQAAQKANEYCAKKGKSAVINNATSSGTAGWTEVSAVLTFTCASSEGH